MGLCHLRCICRRHHKRQITNAKTLLPEAGVKVTHEGSNISKTTAADGIFIFDNIPFGEQTFYFEKPDFIEETITRRSYSVYY